MIFSEIQRGRCDSFHFRSLLVAQFFGALNDNLFKLFVTLLVVRHVIEQQSGITHLVLINICFILPYILFSTIAGGLADKFCKSRILFWAKVLELLVMSLAAFFLTVEASYALLAVLFLMGTQSTLFSPSKYGVLPEMLDEVSLSKGNGYLEFVTFIGIIVGTALAGIVLMKWDFASGVPGLMLVFFSVVGLIAAVGIGQSRAIAPMTTIHWNPLRMWTAAKETRKERGLFMAIIAISFFWSIGALYQLNAVLFGTVEGGLSDLAVSLQLAALGVGIGVGSIAAGKVSEGKVELGLVPLGALGLAFWSIALAWTAQYPVLSGVLLAGVGLSAGFYIVPLNSFLQQRSPEATRGNVLAACNFVSFSGMLLFSLFLLLGIDGIGLKPSGIFLCAGLSAVVIAIYICSVLPEVLLRCLNWLLIHTLYRVRVRGEENLPEQGGGLLVCNHVSMLDACLLLAGSKRPIRFLMYRPYYENRFIHPFAKALGTIPIESGGKDTEHALRGASDAIRSGSLVAIFAEGAITRTGQMLRFRTGLERIMRDVDAPIIPVHLDQMWGSVFSFRDGRFFWKLPRKVPYPVQLSFGKQLPGTSSASEVRFAVQELSAEAFGAREEGVRSLPAAFIRAVRMRSRTVAVHVSRASTRSYSQLLAEVLALRSVLKRQVKRGLPVYIAGEPSHATLCLHLATLALGGKCIPVDGMVTASTLKRVHAELTPRLWIESQSTSVTRELIPEGVELLTYEQLQSSISSSLRLQARLMSMLAPTGILLRYLGGAQDAREDTAAILFSRGTTGEQKIIELSHQNLIASSSSFSELFSLRHEDAIAGSLPLSHPMGYAALLWLPMLAGCSAWYLPHENSESGSVSTQLKDENLTFYFATSTQLTEILEQAKAHPALKARYVIAGGDSISESLRERFAERAAGQLLEAYGAAELSPLALLNVPNYEQAKPPQVGSKPGSLGHPVPGVAIRVVPASSASDREPKSAVRVGVAGELWVKGANIMKGYIGADTSQVLVDGWYRTGDTVQLDADGFVQFLGRMDSRTR